MENGTIDNDGKSDSESEQKAVEKKDGGLKVANVKEKLSEEKTDENSDASSKVSKTSKEEVKEGDKAQFLSYVRESSNVKDNGGSQNAKSSKAEGITLKEKEEKSSVETKDGSKVLEDKSSKLEIEFISKNIMSKL